MGAVSTLPQYHASSKSIIGKSGVLTLSGFGICVRMQRGHLEIHDGVGAERRNFRLPRIGHRLKRLVVIGSDGLISLAALRWLADQDASFIMLERNGKVLCVTGPVRRCESKLRRAQALAMTNDVGLEICRALIDAKLRGQEHVLRQSLGRDAAADVIARFRGRLTSVENVDEVRGLESNAALAYFREWRDIPVQWPKADLHKIPDHWRTVGTRQSPLTGGPRLAVTPVHAVLNYCFSLLEAETRLALAALGLDPGLGVGLHTDTANRDSLALDVLEPVRPHVESWLLRWVATEPFRKSDFFETGTGNCRLMSGLCKQLSLTAPTWGTLVAPWAEFVTRSIWRNGGTKKPISDFAPETRLTQQRRIEAKGKVWIPTTKPLKADHVCRGCGKTIRSGREHCCTCRIDVSTKRMLEVARVGRMTSNSPQANEKRAITQRRNALARTSWDQSRQPKWLTEQFYSEKIRPLLAEQSGCAIAKTMGVSKAYAGRIRAGLKSPHPRHWQALAEMVGIHETHLPNAERVSPSLFPASRQRCNC